MALHVEPVLEHLTGQPQQSVISANLADGWIDLHDISEIRFLQWCHVFDIEFDLPDIIRTVRKSPH